MVQATAADLHRQVRRVEAKLDHLALDRFTEFLWHPPGALYLVLVGIELALDKVAHGVHHHLLLGRECEVHARAPKKFDSGLGLVGRLCATQAKAADFVPGQRLAGPDNGERIDRSGQRPGQPRLTRPNLSRVSSGESTRAPSDSAMLRARSTSCALLANTPRDR